MIYDLWNDEPNVPSNVELEDRILELARNLGEAYDWKRTAPSVISSKGIYSPDSLRIISPALFILPVIGSGLSGP